MLRPGHRRHTAVYGADQQTVWARASVSGGRGSVGGELVARQCARQAKGHGARNTDRPGQPVRADKTQGVRPWWCPLRQWYHEGILPVFRSAGIIRSLKGHDPLEGTLKESRQGVERGIVVIRYTPALPAYMWLASYMVLQPLDEAALANAWITTQ